FPSSSTQQHIAEYLDQKCSDIDKIILAKQRQNELLKEQRQSIIYEAVTKGLDKQVKYKDSGIEWIGEIPEDWEVVRLKFLCETIKTGTTPSTRAKQYFNGTLNWFTPGDFSDKLELVDSGRKLDYSAVVDNEVPIFPAGTIMIIGIGATMGRVGFMLEEGSCNQQLTGLVVKAGIYSRELLYWLYAMSYYVRNMANFTTLPILNNQVLCNISCIVPPIDVQQHIADYLDQKCADIDRIINANNDMIEKLKEYRQSIVYEAVTGKI
ncbi:MAG: restriction endonuclease subunit S, partial [Syntrophomonadaceae bacterium]|nr:restriction endonuclease subunit S [Syntrophomonadaceae bacterium]